MAELVRGGRPVHRVALEVGLGAELDHAMKRVICVERELRVVVGDHGAHARAEAEPIDLACEPLTGGERQVVGCDSSSLRSDRVIAMRMTVPTSEGTYTSSSTGHQVRNRSINPRRRRVGESTTLVKSDGSGEVRETRSLVS